MTCNKQGKRACNLITGIRNNKPKASTANGSPWGMLSVTPINSWWTEEPQHSNRRCLQTRRMPRTRAAGQPVWTRAAPAERGRTWSKAFEKSSEPRKRLLSTCSNKSSMMLNTSDPRRPPHKAAGKTRLIHRATQADLSRAEAYARQSTEKILIGLSWLAGTDKETSEEEEGLTKWICFTKDHTDGKTPSNSHTRKARASTSQHEWGKSKSSAPSHPSRPAALPRCREQAARSSKAVTAGQTSIYLFFAPRVSKKNAKNTTYLTMFGHYENEKKSCRVKTTTTTTTTTTTRRRRRSTQMRQKDVWQDGYKLRYEKNITLCSAPACGTRKAHEQHQRPLLRIHNLTLMASPVCEALQ